MANIEGLFVSLPAQISQRWEPPDKLEGAQYGFSYEIGCGSTVVKRVGPSADDAKWGGRGSGIVRIDGKAYVIPEFWERQPRTITVTEREVILTLFDGSHGFSREEVEFDSTKVPLRSGEDAWDRFAVIDDGVLPDSVVSDEAEALPVLSVKQRDSLRQRFGIAPEGLRGADAGSEAWLRKYDQWQGVSWESKYADANLARSHPINGNTGKTTLFTLFAFGGTYPANSPGIYSWRDYGDIQWGEGMTAGHYDWLRSAFKHYLRTGNVDALRWGMAAMRHAVSVDFQWNEAFQPGDAGFARYEKGSHGLADFPGRPSHTWVEGLFIASALTADPWIREAAVRRSEGTWNYFGGSTPARWDGAYGEIRWITWPLLLQVRAFTETGNQKYWTKARELMREVLRAERLSGSKGYIKNYAYGELGIGSPDAVSSLQLAYSVRGLLEYADVAQARGEWTQAEQEFLVRLARWAMTPMPEGPYLIPTLRAKYGEFLGDTWCPPAGIRGCDLNPDGSDSSPLPLLNVQFSDLLAWLAQDDPQAWRGMARRVFRDAVNAAVHPAGIVGYLSDEFPGSESKVVGKIQLFGDRAAMWVGGMQSRRAKP
jgi:hypothetical protein